MGKVHPLARLILAPLAALFRVVTGVRNLLYDRGFLASYRSSLPVISIGNLTVGGNGKTPLCLFLVEQLRERGYNPVILSRGYGGTLSGPHRVRENDLASAVGDEPLLMSRTGGSPVVIARARAEGARFIEQQGLGDLIVLDDGFQHRTLKRDFDIIAVFAGSDEAIEDFARGELLPLGRFREERDAGLRRASMVVASYRSVRAPGADVGSVDERLNRVIPLGMPVVRASYEFLEVRSLDGERVIPAGAVQAFAGIANPQGFFESLTRVGYTVERAHFFPDHHPFTEAEVSELIDEHPGVLFVCTEKDGVKLREMGERVRRAFAEFRVRLVVEPLDEFVESVIRSIRDRSQS
jgi:tetraacyldisaccharide 4'-kinase